MHSQQCGKLFTDATQSAHNPNALRTISTVLEHGSPERLINFPQGCPAVRCQGQGSSFIPGVAGPTVLGHQDSLKAIPLPSREQCHQRELLTAGHGPLQSRTFFPFALATPKIRANSIFRGCPSNGRDAWAVSRSVDVAQRWCLIFH